jgi:hypothetical protein
VFPSPFQRTKGEKSSDEEDTEQHHPEKKAEAPAHEGKSKTGGEKEVALLWNE